MSDFITLSCPSCGAKLSITPDIDRFACSHCGQEHIIKRGGGIVSLSPVVGAINQVGAGVDRVAAELSTARLHREINELQKEKDDLIEEDPEPKTKDRYIVSLVFGALILFYGIGSKSDNSFCFILFGVILTLAGGGMLIYGYMVRSNWKNRIWKQSRNLDTQIEKRQAQLKLYQDLLSK
jgi:hypothetical protein